MRSQYDRNIQDAIDRYYEQHASSDIAIYGDTFVQRCISSIWGMVISPIRIEYINDSIENLYEMLKQLTGNDNLEIEQSPRNPSQVSIRLPNAIWYIDGFSTYGYHILPSSNDTHRYSVLPLGPQDAAELMLAFDSFIPLILERAEAVIMKKAEDEIVCNIMRVSAEGIIDRLLMNGEIQIKGKATVTSRPPNKIEVGIDNTRWIVSSIQELEALLKRRYAKASPRG